MASRTASNLAVHDTVHLVYREPFENITERKHNYTSVLDGGKRQTETWSPRNSYVLRRSAEVLL